MGDDSLDDAGDNEPLLTDRSMAEEAEAVAAAAAAAAAAEACCRLLMRKLMELLLRTRLC